MNVLYLDHFGISRMKSLRRGYTYWPRMDPDIGNVVKTCRRCALAAKSPPVKLQPWPKMDRQYYLVVVDRCTKWPEIFKRKDILRHSR